jgi:signal transduction histidine kinase
MYVGFLFIVAFSLVFQLAAGLLAVRLVRITGTNWAWTAIAAALLTMALRRLTVLATVWNNHLNFDDFTQFWSESIGLVNAILMLLGIAAIAPLLQAIQEGKESTLRDRNQLEKEVQQRTAELVSTNEKLQAEFDQRAKAEEALRNEHLHLQQVLELSEREQRLLAYDIHDGFVQPATASLMNLQAALSTYASDPDKALEYVVRGVQLVQESLAQVRWLIGDLRSVVLEDLGLVAAIDKLVGDVRNRSETQISWSHQVQFDRLPAPLETAIYRIVQEALRNATRHSQSERIEVSLTQSEKSVVAKVQDWGRGFDASVHKADHFGLEGIRERAKMFGGAARIDSEPGKGTSVTAEFPPS